MSLACKIFSKILFTVLRIEMGLQLFKDLESPFLKIGMTLAIFKLLGYKPVDIDKLKTFTKAGINIGVDNLTNLDVISS